ncbi:UNVERIFIED_ORG: hypothetical protein J2W38_006762 [Variovorax paradoxus]|nr:hypothetical protein [Variovorax paradoxus]
MNEIRKPWKQDGFGGAKEGPLVSVWVTMRGERLDPFDNALEHAKEFVHRDLKHLDRWSVTYSAVKEAEARVRAAETSVAKVQAEIERLESRVAPKIELPPGHGLFHLIRSFAPRKFRERVLDPLRADALQEYYEACEAHDEPTIRRLKYMINVWLAWSVFSGVISAIAGLVRGSSTGISKD